MFWINNIPWCPGSLWNKCQYPIRTFEGLHDLDPAYLSSLYHISLMIQAKPHSLLCLSKAAQIVPKVLCSLFLIKYTPIVGVQFESHHKKPVITWDNQTYPILLSTLLEPNWQFNMSWIIGLLCITWGWLTEISLLQIPTLYNSCRITSYSKSQIIIIFKPL